MVNGVLQDLGLGDKEIDIYLALLKLGSAPASILGRRADITRSTAQYTCQQLLKKGIVRMVPKANTFIYVPEPPEKLSYLLEQQRREIKEKEEKLNLIIPQLQSMLNTHTAIPRIKLFEGISGIIDLANEILEELEGGYPLVAVILHLKTDLPEELVRHQEEIYVPKRRQLKNPSWFIFNDTKEARQNIGDDKDLNRKTLLVPEGNFPFRASCQIYNNKVAFYSYGGSAEPMGILIDSEPIHDTQLSILKLAWDYARELPINKRYRDVEFMK